MPILQHADPSRSSPWTCSKQPAFSFSAFLLLLPSRMFFPPSLFTCCPLLKFQVFSWILISWENFPDPREVKCSLTMETRVRLIWTIQVFSSGQVAVSSLSHWFNLVPTCNPLQFYGVLAPHQNYPHYWTYTLFFTLSLEQLCELWSQY